MAIINYSVVIGGATTQVGTQLPAGSQGTGIRLQDYSVQALVETWSGSVVVDVDQGNTYQATLIGDVTDMSVTGWPPSGEEGKVTLYIKQGTGGYSVAFPVAVKWVGGVVPTLSLTNGDVDVIVLTTVDGGTTIYGFYVGRAN